MGILSSSVAMMTHVRFHASKARTVLFIGWLLPTFLIASSVSADIRVSPVAVYLSDDDLSARVTVQNSGTQTKEVGIDIQFGYPVSDDFGNVSFRFLTPVDASEPSAVEWMRVFPRHFVLAPGESQTMMVIADPPMELPEGEYWARPVLTFQTVNFGETGKTWAQESDALQLVLSMNFRHGGVRTGVRLHAVTAEADMQNATMIVTLERLGNAAFLGNLICRLRNQNGELLAEGNQELAVYHSLKQRIELGTSGLAEGRYVAEVELNTDRVGNSPGDILPAPLVSGRTEFFIKKGVAEVQLSRKTAYLTPEIPHPTAKVEQRRVASEFTFDPGQGPAVRARVIGETIERLRAIQAELDRMLNGVNQTEDR